jgi:redox-sensitive bicupin YhaK (pirin superfamily)
MIQTGGPSKNEEMKMKANEENRIDIRRADRRFLTRTGWLDSKHSFSFGPHYDPDNVGHGLLIVNNDDIVRPGTGFMTHPHQDMEIVTWVLDGELEHKDSEGNKGIIYPGLAQRMSAGTGIWHSEMNPNGNNPVHFVQMWVLPDTERIKPGYEQLDIGRELDKGGLVQIASGKGDHSAISIRQKGAGLWVGRLKPGQSAAIPDAPYVHLFVAKGGVELEGAGVLRTGDAARLTAAGNPRITADADTGAEVLIWESNQKTETR